jgi:NAD(P)-dependent dehydrogenase (short-subunit alcohol dehydrogenase family)
MVLPLLSIIQRLRRPPMRLPATSKPKAAVKADVSAPAAVRACSTRVAFGGIDVLANNAGIMKLAKIAERRCTVRSADRDQSQGQF